MLRWYDGIERYGVIARMTEGIGGGAAWSEVMSNTGSVETGWSISTANPATGTYHLRLTDGVGHGRLIRRVLGVAQQVSGWGYRFSVVDLPYNEGAGTTSALCLFDVRDVSNNSHFMIVLGTDGSVFAKRGARFDSAATDPYDGIAGTLLGRSDPCVARGGFHHIELKTKIDNTNGYIEVRVNQVTVLNLTGIDTQNTANGHVAQFVVGRAGGVKPFLSHAEAGFVTADFDDFFAWDDDASDPENTTVDFVGDKGVYLRKAISDTATSDFTPVGSATAYGAIDEIPPTGTEYLSTASATARTIVGIEPLPANVAEVIAMMPVLYARKEESGAVNLRGGLVSGTDETYGPEDTPSTAYAFLRPGPKTIDPATGAPWASDAAPKLLIERTA